jgi:hypothetical protein
MTDIDIIRAEIEKLPGILPFASGKGYASAIRDALSIIDKHREQAVPKKQWDAGGYGVWYLWEPENGEAESAVASIRVLDDGEFSVEVLKGEWVELEPTFPTLKAAQLAAEKAMEEMEKNNE